jgi:hypothetical protein
MDEMGNCTVYGKVYLLRAPCPLPEKIKWETVEE